MGWLTHALSGSGVSGGSYGLNFGAYQPYAPNPQTGFSERSLLEKIDLNQASKSAVGLFGELGRAPSRVYEAPVSLVDTALSRVTGFSPVQAIGKTPLGAAGGFLGEAVKRTGNFVPSLINSGDAEIWSAVSDLPDDTPLTDDLVSERLGITGLHGFITDYGENTGGLPILGLLGIGSRPKTVAEFRQELAERGFFYDETTGEALDPTQVGLDIRNGSKSKFDYGYAAVNDNALVDFATRMGTDPTNALFFVPGANIAKAGSLLGRVFSLGKLAKIGIATAEVAPVAAKSAEAISAGSRAGATLAGMGRVLAGYRKVALGTAATEFAVNRVTGFAAQNDLPVPFAREINDFTNAVEKNQPLSGNAAFMLFSAATFPYNSTVIRPIRTAAGKLRDVTVGVDEMAPFSKAFGGRSKFEAAVGGKQGMSDLHGFLLVQEARARHMLTPAEESSLRSMPDLALRRKFEQQAFERRGARAWADGEITAHDLLDRFKVWAEEQGGVVSHDAAGNLIDQGVRLPFDPERAARTWRTFRDGPVSVIKPVLDQTGELIWGERDDVIFHEQIDLGLDTFRGLAKVGKDGERRVPKGAVLDFLEDNPNINSLDKYGFWQRIIADEADPLLKHIEDKLRGQKRTAVSTSDYFADAARWEQTAPPDPVVPDGPISEPRGERINRLRSRLDEIEREGANKTPKAPGSYGGTSGYKNIESVPTSVLEKFRHVDRELEDQTASVGRRKVDELTASIRDRGFDEEVILEYSVADGTMVLIEGNHRLAAAKRLGIESMPARVVVRQGSFGPKWKPYAKKAPKDLIPDEFGYVPSDVRPSDVLDLGNKEALDPKLAAEHQAVQRQLEDEIASANDVRWSRDNSIDPELGRAVEEALPEVDPNLAPEFVYPGLRGDPAMVSRVVALEQELRDAGLHTKYRVKAVGTDQALATIPDRPIIANIRKYTAVGDWLFERSPFSAFSKFMYSITRPVGRGELARGQKQALMNELIPRGFSAKQVNLVVAALEQRVRESVFIDKGSFQARLYRDPGSLLPGQVAAIARRVLVEEAATPASALKAAKVLAAIERDGGMYRVLSRAGSRYWRSIHSKALAGDRGARALQGIYRVWSDAPILHNIATSQRVLAKFVYPLARFLIDPRWLMLNTIEGETLAFSKSGITKAYQDLLDASPAARRAIGGQALEEALASFSPDVGVTLTNKNLQLLLLKDFDIRSAKSIGKVIDQLGESDPALVAIRRRMAREADDLTLQASRATDAEEAAKLTRRADALRQEGTGPLSRYLNDTLYRYEKEGPAKAIKSEFEKFLDQDELDTMKPLIDRVVEVNQQTWHDVQSLYHGNPSRSTLERVGNSYWLYWPLSYQIKATKWLADIMLNGSFGHENGALLAGKYALWRQQHEDRMAKNPAYRAMYAANPEMWFFAQMLLPMSPESIGVSLGKATDIAGERGQNFINSWLGTDIGLFTRSISNEKAIPFLTEMGPIYSGELLSRIYAEADKQGFFRPAPDIARPAQ